MCKKNMCWIDRSARIVLGLAIGITTLLNAFGPNISWVLSAIGLALIVFGAIGICPLYSVLKFSTLKSCGCDGENSCGCASKEAKTDAKAEAKPAAKPEQPRFS